MNKKKLRTASVRRFERQLKLAQQGDEDMFMILLAIFFKDIDDCCSGYYWYDYDLFTALVEKAAHGIHNFDVGKAYQIEVDKRKQDSLLK